MLRRLARPLIGLAFIDSGVTALREPEERTERARSMGVQDPQKATRAVAATQVAAGLLLILNKMPRLASLVLALTVVPEAATGHAFWTQQDKLAQRQERSLFARDLGLLGGLLVSVADTGSRASVPHMTAKAARRAAGKTVKTASKTAAKVTP